MAISDEKLMLLEQITYMDANVYKTLGWDYPGDMNQIMNNINNLSDEQLVNLDTLQVDSTDITGSEWKGILSAIKADNELSALECTGYDGKVGAFCFTNPDTNEAFVTFRGTMDENGEWKDNVDQLSMADTPAQIAALEYVNGLKGYDSVTLVGHSKGGNKAQYCAILADEGVNVDRCVSMDGEGFSIDFLQKYESQIKQNGSKITDYSYKKDFVNPCLNDVPGSRQVYCEGDDQGSLARQHFSNTMFEIVETEDGYQIIYAETEQDPTMKFLHGFSCYLANSMPLKERKKISKFLNGVLDIVRSGDVDKKQLEEYFLANQESATLVAGYLVKYMDEQGISNENIKNVLDEFGLSNVKIQGYDLYTIITWARKLAKCDDGHLDWTDVVEVGVTIKGGKTVQELEKNLKKGYKKANENVQTARQKGGGLWYDNKINKEVGNKRMIVVTPELLKSQADEMNQLMTQFNTLSAELKLAIDSSSKAMSQNMQCGISARIGLLKARIVIIADMLSTGAQAAQMAASSYESIDQSLAKQIYNT